MCSDDNILHVGIFAFLDVWPNQKLFLYKTTVFETVCYFFGMLYNGQHPETKLTFWVFTFQLMRVHVGSYFVTDF
jgi:hypothetical protein